MNTSFGAWWDFCQRPENDGVAEDAAPGDPPTRWGFTYPTWLKAIVWHRTQYSTGPAFKTIAAFQRASQADMRLLAKNWHWKRQGGDDLPAGADMSVLDWAWTSGGAIRDIQTRLRVEADGLIGPLTIGAIRSYPDFIDAVYVWRCMYYDNLDLRAIYSGLYRRALECRDLSMELERG